MNKVFRRDPQLSFLTDFTEDTAEKRAAELMEAQGQGHKPKKAALALFLASGRCPQMCNF